MIRGDMSAIIAQRAVVLELCIPTAARSGEILSLSTAPRLGQPGDMLTERTQDMGDNVGPNGLSRGCKIYCLAAPLRLQAGLQRKDRRWPTISRSMTTSITSCRGRRVAPSPSSA